MQNQQRPSLRPQNMRQMARAGVMDQAMQDPMQQIMQMMQIQQGAQQMQQTQEESPIQMALKQLQLESLRQGLDQGQQIINQNALMNPEELLRIQLLNQATQRDMEMQRLQEEAMRAAGGGAAQGAQAYNPANF